MLKPNFEEADGLGICFFSFVSGFCNSNTTCNGQGTCGNEGHCQCADGLYGENCSGKLTNCMSSKPCSRVYRNCFLLIVPNTCCPSYSFNKNCKYFSHFSIKSQISILKNKCHQLFLNIYIFGLWSSKIEF